jgi:hypothetical protein
MVGTDETGRELIRKEVSKRFIQRTLQREKRLLHMQSGDASKKERVENIYTLFAKIPKFRTVRHYL